MPRPESRGEKQESTTDEHGYTQIESQNFLSVKIRVYPRLIPASLCLCASVAD
jgi:hypothetical protein